MREGRVASHHMIHTRASVSADRRADCLEGVTAQWGYTTSGTSRTGANVVTEPTPKIYYIPAYRAVLQWNSSDEEFVRIDDELIQFEDLGQLNDLPTAAFMPEELDELPAESEVAGIPLVPAGGDVSPLLTLVSPQQTETGEPGGWTPMPGDGTTNVRFQRMNRGHPGVDDGVAAGGRNSQGTLKRVENAAGHVGGWIGKHLHF